MNLNSLLGGREAPPTKTEKFVAGASSAAEWVVSAAAGTIHHINPVLNIGRAVKFITKSYKEGRQE